MWERLEDVSERQQIDLIDLLAYLLSKHERCRIKVIAGDFIMHEAILRFS